MPNSLVSLTSDLISIDSVTDNQAGISNVISYIANFSRSAGLEVSNYDYNHRPSLLISLTPQTPKLLLNGHADVVPAKPEQFQPVIQGKKLYGRGAQDMKSGLAAMLYLISELKSQKKSYPVSLMVVTDEEIGGFDGSKRLLHDLNLKPSFVIAGESTDLAIEYEAKGVTQLKIKSVGSRAHSAYLWEGKNAIRRLIRDLAKLSSVYPEPTEFVWETTCNVGKISGGLATNQVPNLAEAVLDIRRIPKETTSQVIKTIQSIFESSDTTIEILMDEPSHSVSRSNSAIKLLDSVIAKTTKVPTHYIQKCGASDARHFSAVNIPAICFGPTGSGLHTDSECLDIPSLTHYYSILKDFTSSYFSV